MVYVVTYDLMQPGQNYPAVADCIRALGPCIKPLQSTWLVSSNLAAKEVFNRIHPTLDSNDKLLVILADKNWHASLTQDDYNWLRKYLAS